MACPKANAQHWHHHHHRVVTVVERPVVVSHVSNRLGQKERLAMAVAYIGIHKQQTIKQYAKMTQLTKNMAEAELDAFAYGTKSPITVIVKGKKKVYVKKDCV